MIISKEKGRKLGWNLADAVQIRYIFLLQVVPQDLVPT